VWSFYLPLPDDYDSRTPLHLAAAEGQDKAVQYLIAKGADVNFKDRWGNTALADAVKSGHVQVVEQILSRGGSLTISMGAVEMCNAATEGDVRYLKLLIRCGMNACVIYCVSVSRPSSACLPATVSCASFLEALLPR
jgi:potassium channel